MFLKHICFYSWKKLNSATSQYWKPTTQKSGCHTHIFLSQSCFLGNQKSNKSNTKIRTQVSIIDDGIRKRKTIGRLPKKVFFRRQANLASSIGVRFRLKKTGYETRSKKKRSSIHVNYSPSTNGFLFPFLRSVVSNF